MNALNLCVFLIATNASTVAVFTFRRFTMAPTLAEFEEGLREYEREIASRSPEIRKREAAFPLLAAKFAASQPPQFNREDLEAIMEWKHTDTRWRNRALEGLQSVGDDLLLTLTTKIGRVELSKLASEFEGKIYGSTA
jgi:hypothetical protein